MAKVFKILFTLACPIFLLFLFSFASPVRANSTFNVNSTIDAVDANPGDGVCETSIGNGDCTLRAAVMEANALSGEDTINIPAGTYSLTIGTDLVVSDSVNISGAGKSVVTLGPRSSARAFDILAGVTANITGLSITHEEQIVFVSEGGGIRNRGSLSLSDVDILESIFAPSVNGGGIFSSGNLTLTNVSITRQLSGWWDSGGGNGAGLYNSGTAVLNQVNIHDNYSGANNNCCTARGGGVFNGGTITITNSTLRNNYAANGPGTGQGGHLYNVGTANLSDVNITQGRANAGGGLGQGGGVYNAVGGELSLNRLDMVNIDAGAAGSGEGGAIHNAGHLTFNRGTIIGSSGAYSGNGHGYGGGIFNSGTCELSNLDIEGTSGLYSGSGAGLGGGVFNAGSCSLSVITVGGAHGNNAGSGNGDGGGIYNTGNLTIRDLYIQGGAGGSSTIGRGGGIFNTGNLNLQKSLIAYNYGGYGTSVNGNGGGLFNSGTATIINSTFDNNTTAGGNSPTGNGGAIYNSNSVTLQNSTLSDNYLSSLNDSGASIYNTSQASISVVNTIISTSTANSCSGTITSLGYNLDSGTSCALNSIGDQSSTDPQLSTLSSSGGFTQTRALLSGSPAIDAGDNSSCPTTDQRGVGFPRPSDGNGDNITICDIGAYEFQNPNQPPTANAGGPYSVNEGSSVQVTATGNDPENGPLTYAWDLDNNGSFETSGQNVSFSASGLDGPDIRTIAVQVTDNGNLTSTDQATVNITNANPVVGTITAPTDPTLINTSINTSASFTDSGTPDTHTAVWNWGDNTTSTGTVTESNGSGSVSGSHTYTTAGVYTVSVTVTDDDSGSGQSTFDYVVIYDSNPSGGFLTGAGKYNSQAGWYTPDSQVGGEVKFGIQAQYNGGSTPTGQTKLNFKDSNLELKSTSYQWLVVTGTKATLKGNGTINGAGNYTFLASAIDGSPDLLRFQIKDGSNVIYDTQAGAGDTADPITSLTLGSIHIH